MRSLYTYMIIVGVILGTVSSFAYAQSQSTSIPASPPPGLARDHIMYPEDVLPLPDTEYEELIRKFVPVMEAERRATMSTMLRNLLQVADHQNTTQEEVDEAIKNVDPSNFTRETIIPYPNFLNAKFWKLYPATLEGDTGEKVTVLPYSTDDDALTDQNSIFPLKALTWTVGEESTQIPTFSESFRRMLRIKRTFTCYKADTNAPSSSCITNPFTGLKSDKDFRRIQPHKNLPPKKHLFGGEESLPRQWYYADAVEECAKAGGRLPSVEEAYYFLGSRSWVALDWTLEELIAIATAPIINWREYGVPENMNFYYVLTNNILDVHFDANSDYELPKTYSSKTPDVLAIRVPRSIDSVGGFDYDVKYNRLVQLRTSPEHNDHFINRTVFYCVYD